MTTAAFRNPTILEVPRRLGAGVLVSLALLAAVSPAAAQEAWGQSKGASLGLKLVIDGTGEGEAANPGDPHIDAIGAGLALVGGYTWSPRFHTRLVLGSATHGTSVPDFDVQRSWGTFEAHYRFLPERQVCPYAFGALGGSDVRAEEGPNRVKFSGGTAGIGAGLLVGFTPRWVLDLSSSLEGINWNKAEWSQDQPGGGTLQYQNAIEESGGAFRIDLGLLYQF